MPCVRIGRQSLPAVRLALACSLITGGVAIAASPPASPAIKIDQLGAIPTYYYDLPAEKMLELIMLDAYEGRKRFSMAKPSHLDAYVVRAENVGEEEGAFRAHERNTFASNSGNLICVSVVNLTVSQQSSQTQGASAFVQRNCAPGGPDLWTTWARSTTFASVASPGLSRLYAAYGVAVRYNPSGTSGLRAQSFSPSSMNIGTEVWGQTFFNGYGNSAIAQEMVITVAEWR